MVVTVGVESMSGLSNVKVTAIVSDKFDSTAVISEALPSVTVLNGGTVNGDSRDGGGEFRNGVLGECREKKREIVLGKNVHARCLEVTEPDADDEWTGDKEAYMASVLARYRKTLVERTNHHLVL
ncbi:unnamed protein product [Ilex paraguariensis]|uniref:Transposase n=1 Tax=Ilex paraguariensis TaxID=185542 RepID=A0ABC8V290_9AQUA